MDRIEQLKESFERSSVRNLYSAGIVSFKKEELVIVINEQPAFKRPSGVFNGATIAAMVDTAAGFLSAAQYPNDSYMATVELKVNYLRPAFGEMLQAVATCLKAGKQLAIIRVEVYGVSENEKSHVSTALVTMMCTKIGRNQ
ncbi:PaaI family thioesterase [Gynurincola endophyticus]|uniref:PaaI family thioesterase n=1 Tax=Gynurincola endophyticus TaxID=2479004 RepID=UPI000F8EB9D3|nr:PaaI family thioesterase [Gynurincola endophyticus]